MDTISANIHYYKNISFFKNSDIWAGPYRNDNVGLFFICSIDGVTFKYYVELNLLKLTTSITKFLYDTNTRVFNYTDLDSFYSRLNILIRFALKDNTIAKFQTWNCSRLDLSSNFICKNVDDKRTYLSSIKNSKFSRYKKDEYATSVHAHNKSLTINIYDKNEEEFSKNHVSTDDEILRIEFQLKNSKLYRLFNSKKSVSAILENPERLKEIYCKELEKLGLNITLTTLKSTLNKIDNLLSSNIIKQNLANNLKDYIQTENKSLFSDSTIYRYNKILKDNNINPNFLDRQVSNKIDFNNFELFFTRKSLDSLGVFMLLTYINFLVMVINVILPSITDAFNYYRYLCSNLASYIISFYDDS